MRTPSMRAKQALPRTALPRTMLSRIAQTISNENLTSTTAVQGHVYYDRATRRGAASGKARACRTTSSSVNSPTHGPYTRGRRCVEEGVAVVSDSDRYLFYE